MLCTTSSLEHSGNWYVHLCIQTIVVTNMVTQHCVMNEAVLSQTHVIITAEHVSGECVQWSL